MALIDISKNLNGSTITINEEGNSKNDVFISKINVSSQGNSVTLQWDETHYIEALYTEITVSGTPYGSAVLTEEAIGALLVLPTGGGGGGIGGGIIPPQVAYGGGVDSITGDPSFLFNNDGNKEVTANKYKVAQTTLLGSPADGYFEFDGTNYYLTIGTTRYIVQLALAP